MIWPRYSTSIIISDLNNPASLCCFNSFPYRVLSAGKLAREIKIPWRNLKNRSVFIRWRKIFIFLTQTNLMHIGEQIAITRMCNYVKVNSWYCRLESLCQRHMSFSWDGWLQLRRQPCWLKDHLLTESKVITGKSQTEALMSIHQDRGLRFPCNMLVFLPVIEKIVVLWE